MPVFNPAAFTTSNSTPSILLEYGGPVGQPGPGAELFKRFGKWRRSAFSGVYMVHDNVSVGFTYRTENDIAVYDDTPLVEFENAFKHKLGVALTTVHGNAMYFEHDSANKYLGLDMIKILNYLADCKAKYKL
jgi:hypothetical protein